MSMKSQIPCRKTSADGDRYEVLEKIGHGSFGVIHKVRRKADGLILCRKEISYTRMTQKEREQLSAELSILKELRHKNIVAYYEREHFKSTQDLHLYMEYCGNGDLGRYIKNLKLKNEYADEDFVWTIFSQLVTALYRCHYGEDAPPVQINSLGFNKDAKPVDTSTSSFMILHRDLKPENVKLGDFGLSKILQSQGFAETYVGTPFYMSPEICNGEKYTLYSDLWSLGCIIYELCSHNPPFNATTHLALIQKIKSGKISRIPAQYSNELQDVINQCLSVNPNKRPDTAKLLNHPRVKLMRKEQMIVEWAAELEAKEASLNGKTTALREELETRVRQECEMKCNLEHTRLIEIAKQDHLQSLQNQFEAEVQRRVAFEVELQVARIKQELEHKYATDHTLTDASLPSLSSGSQSSASDAEVPPQSQLPSLSPKQPRSFKRGVRTPFCRAQTYSVCQPSPMDVTMVDPSPAPAPVSNLNLSPRRMPGRALAGTDGSRKWTSANNNNTLNPPSSPTISLPDDSDLEACLESLDTPTKVKPRENSASAQQPSRPHSSIMPKLPRMMPPLFAAKSGVPKQQQQQQQQQSQQSSGTDASNGSGGFAAVRRPISIVPVIAASPTRKVPSPQKFQPRRAAPLSPACRGDSSNSGAGTGGGFQTKRGNEDLLKTALHGKTLVELSQGRAAMAMAMAKGGAPPTTKVGSGTVNTSAGNDENQFDPFAAKKKAYADPPMWDPLRDVMPSPFVVRMKARSDLGLLNAL